MIHSHFVAFALALKVVKVALNGPAFVSGELVLGRMVPPHSIYKARKGGAERPKEFLSPGRYQLINKSVVVRIDPLEEVCKVVQEQDVELSRQGMEESLVGFIGRNIHGAAIGNVGFANVVDCLGTREIAVLLLKLGVTTNVHGMEITITIGVGPFPHPVTKALDDSGSGTLDVVPVTHIVTNETFCPQILFPVLKEEEAVKVDQQPYVDNARKGVISWVVEDFVVQVGFLLQPLVVKAQFGSVSGHDFGHAVPDGSIDRCRSVDPSGGGESSSLFENVFLHLLEGVKVVGVVLGGEGAQAILGSPRDLRRDRLEPLFEIPQKGVVPIRLVLGRKRRFAPLVFQFPRHGVLQ